MELLGALHFNVTVDAGSSAGLIIKAFRWRFGHGGDVLFILKLVSMYGCVVYHVMNQNKYCGIN